ncbi:MAG TPA: hypothetical protein VFZ34_15845 [Blastocatellia bacterium]|nr:hypothetical protein [Blastocatellia bacterium]
MRSKNGLRMVSKTKALLGALGIVLIGLAFEFLREYNVYQNDRRRLNAAFQQLKYGMTREDVTQIMGKPDHKGDLNLLASDSGEIWYWKAIEDPGFIWRTFVSLPQRPLLVATVWFQGEGLVHRKIGN